MTRRLGERTPGEARGISLAPRSAVVDWSAVAASRTVTFATITVTESSNWTDHANAAQLRAALHSGVHAGVRHLARPGGAADQARHAVRTGMPLGAFAPGTLAPTLDARADGVDDRFVRTWIRTVRQAAVIRRVLVYADGRHWQHRFQPRKWADDDVVLWSSWHNGIPGRPGWFHPRLGVHEHGPADVEFAIGVPHASGGAAPAGAGGVPGPGTPVEEHALVYPFTLADVLV